MRKNSVDSISCKFLGGGWAPVGVSHFLREAFSSFLGDFLIFWNGRSIKLKLQAIEILENEREKEIQPHRFLLSPTVWSAWT